MEIDWFTTGAQVLNFLVLVWLLKRFLYAPIINAMDAREERIANRMEQAKAREEEAEGEAKKLRDERDAFARAEESRMHELERELAEERKHLLEEARDEVSRAKQEWIEALERDQEGLLREFRERAEERLFAILRRVLADVADSELDRRTVEVFLERLTSVDPVELKALTPAGEDGLRRLHVRTAFELDEKQELRVQRRLRELFGAELEVDFGVEEQLLAGIELRLDGRKFGWSLSDYLDGLEEELWAEVRRVAPESATFKEADGERRVS